MSTDDWLSDNTLGEDIEVVAGGKDAPKCDAWGNLASKTQAKLDKIFALVEAHRDSSHYKSLYCKRN